MTMPTRRASWCLRLPERPVPEELAREEREGEGLMALI